MQPQTRQKPTSVNLSTKPSANHPSGRTVGILVSEEEYESMRNFYANRLLHTLKEVGYEAQKKGLTDEKLAELLANES